MKDTPHVGTSPLRREDEPHLRGQACFTDDLHRPQAVHAAVARSPHPHARIRRIDVAAARSMHGVLDVVTGDDLDAAGVGPIPSFSRTPPFAVANRDGTSAIDGSQPVLARDRVRYLGEAVAFVVAESPSAAREAAEAIEVDYEPLPAVMTFDEAVRDDAPRLWGEGANATLDWECGDPDGVQSAFATASQRVSIRADNNRVAPVFMEPRGALAEPAGDRVVLFTGSQTSHRLRSIIAPILGWEESALRVVAPDIGGGFGARGTIYPEQVLVTFMARRLGRSVRWTAERWESFLTDCQARDQLLIGELAIDGEGRFTALRAEVRWRHGGYLGPRNLWVIRSFLAPCLSGVYRIPNVSLRIRGAFTNTTPHAAYRGVGRVESTYLMESLVELAALRLGIDRHELRRRNLVCGTDLPWDTGTGARYEACDFARSHERALARFTPERVAERRADAERRGRLYGYAVTPYVENDGGAPSEYAEVEALASGEIQVRIGTQDFGMGHATTFSQILADVLEVPMAAIRIVEGDTDVVARGSGSHGSRSIRVGGSALSLGGERLMALARERAADLTEVAVEDVAYERGRLVVAGTDRAMTLAEVAAAADSNGERLAADADFTMPRESYSSGAHACEVEVDPETGRVWILSHLAVADVGRAVNPMIVGGQMHGGAAQGLGQAACEGVAYDAVTGQTLTGSFMDYVLPRADDLPAFEIDIVEIPETDNPLRVKGIGEGATTGAPPAFMNAVRDALGERGWSVSMPVTAEAIWRALDG